MQTPASRADAEEEPRFARSLQVVNRRNLLKVSLISRLPSSLLFQWVRMFYLCLISCGVVYKSFTYRSNRSDFINPIKKDIVVKSSGSIEDNFARLTSRYRAPI